MEAHLLQILFSKLPPLFVGGCLPQSLCSVSEIYLSLEQGGILILSVFSVTFFPPGLFPNEPPQTFKSKPRAGIFHLLQAIL